MADVIDILKKVGAILENDHFVLTSGRHSDIYLNKDALYPHTQETSQVGKLFAQKNKDLEIDAVVGPAIGAIILSQWTAYHLSRLKGREVLGIYTEKNAEGDQILRRGYDQLVKGKNVLIVEDLTATGGSVAKVVKNVKNAGGKVVMVSVMVNRDPENIGEKTVGAPFNSLGVYPAKSFDAAECPMCKNHVPVNTSVGHGRTFVESKK